MRKYRLHKLPQLLNVLRGEMTLVGPHPWNLYDAARVSPNSQGQMNAMPGITGVWQMQERPKLLELDEILHCDLEYLKTWSLRRDLKIMLLTVPRILSDCGAC
jgi:lipopolysaccharide/colanic/teichoic acid biosynthesis glycosyltransferase